MRMVPPARGVRASASDLPRFPGAFMFQLTPDEARDLRSQAVTPRYWGGRRYLPRAFTEQGVAMLSSVLRSGKAALVNVEIMRAFVRTRGRQNSLASLARSVRALVESARNNKAKRVTMLGRVSGAPSHVCVCAPWRGMCAHSADEAILAFANLILRSKYRRSRTL